MTPPSKQPPVDATRSISLNPQILESEHNADANQPQWLVDKRGELSSGRYLIYRELDQAVIVHRIERESTRIGRSLGSEIRFDDSTVSRKHAVVSRETSDTRILDNRSLNGVFVNGTRCDSQLLKSGDELLIGRHTLFYIEVSE